MIPMLLPPVRLPLLLALLLATVAVAACGGDDDDDAVAAPAATTAAPAATEAAAPAGGEVVEVSIAEFTVIPAVNAAAADGIMFRVSNDGVGPHEFVVIRSDAAPDALPQAAGIVDESQVEVVGRIDEWPGEGETREATFSLAPGTYLLVCNQPGHYQLGMTAAFTVE